MNNHNKEPYNDISKNNLSTVITGKTERQGEYKRRNDAYIHKSINPDDLEAHEGEGWELQRKFKTRTQIKKLKPNEKLLEDRTWCLFYRMGYSELNIETIEIFYNGYDGSAKSQKIDIFAKDDETVVITECISQKEMSALSLDQNITNTTSAQKSISNVIKQHYGQEFKPKIIWLYVTKNITWSESDAKKAARHNIRTITENEMHYFDAFIKHMGPAGRFQFLAEFLERQEIPGLSNIKVPAIRGKLGGKQFYSFVTTPRHLLKIAFINHQALNHPDGRPAYQRMIAPHRIQEIGNFIKNKGFFPSNILINFTEECKFDLISNKDNADPNIKFGLLHLPNTYKSALIIDGQHRLYGYSHLEDELLDQNIAVIAFEKMAAKDEAELFVTINQKQKTVQKSVILSLQADLKWGSEDPTERRNALASTLVKSFNSDSKSPFFQRFVLDGITPKDNQSLSLPEFVKGLNKSNLLGKVDLKSELLIPGPLSGVTDDDTIEKARKIINGYFSLIRDTNTIRWNAGKEAHICTNPGIRANLSLLSYLFEYLTTKNHLNIETLNETTLLTHIAQEIKPLTEYFKATNDTVILEKFSKKLGEVGVNDYFYQLCSILNESNSEFGPKVFFERRSKQNDERIQGTHQDIIALGQKISDYVIKILKRAFGTHEDKHGGKIWWEQGIENSKIKQSAYNKFQEGLNDKQLPIEAYLDVLDHKEIVRKNWALFEKVFSIPMPDERKGKAYYLDWMDDFNKIRRIPAHPSETRGYDEEDYAFIKYIKDEFYTRLDKAEKSS